MQILMYLKMLSCRIFRRHRHEYFYNGTYFARLDCFKVWGKTVHGIQIYVCRGCGSVAVCFKSPAGFSGGMELGITLPEVDVDSPDFNDPTRFVRFFNEVDTKICTHRQK